MTHSAFVQGSSQLRPDAMSEFPDLTSTPIQPPPYANLLEDIEAAHDMLDGLEEELHPPSRPSSPNFEARADALKAKITEAMQYAGYNPRSAKWKRVADLLKLAATSRRYVGAGRGVRMGELVPVDLGNYQFVLPETEEEWEQCEDRWAKRFEKEPTPEAVTSKFFPEGTEAQRPSRKADLVRDKVVAWQAKVVHAPPSGSQDNNEVAGVPPAKEKGKETEKTRQSPLPFPVVKRHTPAATSGKGSPAAGKKAAQDDPVARSPQPSPQNALDKLPSSPKGIADLSEMEFIPPSFPQQLETSTPPPNATKKAKPPPIPRQLPSSPSSSPQLPNSLEHLVPPLGSPCGPIRSSGPSTKRARPITPPSEGSPSSPLAKRMKPVPSSDPVPPDPQPPSTPLLPASPPKTPPRAVSAGNGLGNAMGLPVPSTPNRGSGTPGALPTLSELLASSRRFKPRPRPPSRKLRSAATTPAPDDHASVRRDADLAQADADALPALLVAEREASPAHTVASRTRTLLSSPASGSSVPSRPRSPVSPLFAHSTAFAPPFASTQAGAAPMPASQPQLGYNSQFDVEGQVGMVSDLLEKDVDFDGWLRDIPEVETEK